MSHFVEFNGGNSLKTIENGQIFYLIGNFMFVSVDISPICYLTFQKATYESDIFNYLHFIINDYDLRVGLEKYIIASNTTKKKIGAFPTQ